MRQSLRLWGKSSSILQSSRSIDTTLSSSPRSSSCLEEALLIGSRHVFDSAVLKDAVGKPLIPAMEGRMTFLYGHKQTLSGCADLIAGSQTHQHLGPAFAQIFPDLRLIRRVAP
ncbi:MAG: hypothetical protein Ct9H300mP30_0380 [Methanobacteriota archaeon]|nr:MAG: hypothetical protein Ct9H300mP30_0380 [Euryarchaeota archaeon]